MISISDRAVRGIDQMAHTVSGGEWLVIMSEHVMAKSYEVVVTTWELPG
jgi:hypothetical protein